MIDPVTDPTLGEPLKWRRTRVACAVISGAFCLVVITMLLVNHYRAVPASGPLESAELDRLKQELAEKPKDEALKHRIRTLDLQIRHDFFQRLDFGSRGAYLLVIGVIAFLLSLKWTFARVKPQPDLQMPPDPPANDDRMQRWSFWSILAVGVVLAGVGLLGGFGSREPPRAITPKFVVEGPATEPAGFPSASEILENWPQFRGPGGLGRASYDNIPTSWNGKTGQGILWKTAVPLPGNNSPVVWNDRVFLSGATKRKRQVFCFDAGSGKLRWTGEVRVLNARQTEAPEVTEETGYAAPTCVTDGRRVWAIFANGDVACFDFQGTLVWARNLGVPDNPYGHASSLALYRDRLLVLYDQGRAEDGKSALLGLDASTGRTVWKRPRAVEATWTSPILIEAGQRKQLITAANPWLMAYDPLSGEELWRVKGLKGELGASPSYGNGLVFAVSPYDKLMAVRADGRGDVTATGLAWTAEDGLPQVPSPVCDDQRIYLLTDDGLLTCYRQRDGKKLWEHDFMENFHASPTLVGDRLYVLTDEGVMIIGQVGNEYRQIGRAELNESTKASPAFVSGRIYIRGANHLYCISDEKVSRNNKK